MNDTRTSIGAVLATLTAAVSTVRATAPWQADDPEVADLVVQLEVAMRALAGVQLSAIAEGLTRGLPLACGAGTGRAAPARWLRSLVAINPGDARHRADLAAALFSGPQADELEPTRAAVLAGSISPVHAGHVVDAVERLLPPATPAGLVDDATRVEAQALLLQAGAGDRDHPAVDPTQLAKAALALTATLDPGYGDRLAQDEDRQHQLRTFAVTALPDGMCHAQGLLTKEVGHALIGVLQALSAPQPAADGTPDPRTAGMRTHDGLAHAVRLLRGADELLPSAHGSPNRLVVSVTAQTLAAHLGLTPSQTRSQIGVGALQVPELPGRWPLSPLSAQVMACDADLVAVLTGPDGSPLDVADTIYPFSTRQRAAIIDRDRHCTFGTCTAPPGWCHVHHVKPFSRGGPTSVQNGALLCGVHHRYVHAHDLMGSVTGGRVLWHAPTGSVQNPHLPPVCVTAAITALATRWRTRQDRAAAHQDDTG